MVKSVVKPLFRGFFVSVNVQKTPHLQGFLAFSSSVELGGGHTLPKHARYPFRSLSEISAPHPDIELLLVGVKEPRSAAPCSQKARALPISLRERNICPTPRNNLYIIADTSLFVKPSAKKVPPAGKFPRVVVVIRELAVWLTRPSARWPDRP